MKNLISTPAKRALALALALVLVLSIVPAFSLTATAVDHTAGWAPITKYNWVKGAFTTTDQDLVYEGNQAYDWKFTLQQARTSARVSFTATIRDEQGRTISTYSGIATVENSTSPSVMFSASNFPGLTEDLYGTFTLTASFNLIDLNNEYFGTLTQTFKRVEEEKIEVAASSRSNPDLIFTHADPIDLVLNIKKSDGVSESFTAAVSVTNQSGNEVMNGQTKIKSSTNVSISVKALMNISAITSPGTYKANVTLTNSSGNQVHTATFPFCVVALSNTVNASITSATNSDMSFGDGENIDLVVNLSKADNIREGFTGRFTITDANGRALVTKTMDIAAFTSTSVNIADVMDLSAVPLAGSFKLNAVLTDDAGNVRCSKSVSFTRTSSASDSITLNNSSSAKIGNIYNQDDDFQLVLNIYKPSLAGQTLQVACTGTLNDAALNETLSVTLSSQGAASVNIDGTSLLAKYGVYKDLAVKVYAPNGNELFAADTTYTFSRVLATADPGDMPLVNINDHFTTDNGDAAMKLNLSAQAGFGMWRCSIPWVSVESTPGNYSMPVSVDEVMKVTEDLGMEPLIILAYGNDNLYGLPDPTNDSWLMAYANYCRYIAQYFGDRVNQYEIWNEWNHSTMGKTHPARRSGNYYAMALVAASEAIKSVNPNAKIIGGAMAGHDEGWITAMMNYDGNRDGKSDAWEAMDGFSFHAYNTNWSTSFYRPSEMGYLESYDEVIAVLSRYGDVSTKEIWMTETGWSTAIGPGVTEEEQGAYIVQVNTWALANPDKVDRIFWYDLMNDRDANTLDWDPTAGEHNWGLIHSWTNTGNEPLPYSAKQSYVAASAFNSMMAGAQYADTIQLGDGIQAYRFQKNGEDLVVAWTTGTATKTIRCSGSMDVTDMYGTTTNNLTSATLSECPIYIVCNSGSLSAG